MASVTAFVTMGFSKANARATATESVTAFVTTGFSKANARATATAI